MLRRTALFLFINTTSPLSTVVDACDLDCAFLSWAPGEVTFNFVALWLLFHGLSCFSKKLLMSPWVSWRTSQPFFITYLVCKDPVPVFGAMYIDRQFQIQTSI